mgnify:FL=1|jgi:hypothetical protein
MASMATTTSSSFAVGFCFPFFSLSLSSFRGSVEEHRDDVVDIKTSRNGGKRKATERRDDGIKNLQNNDGRRIPLTRLLSRRLPFPSLSPSLSPILD